MHTGHRDESRITRAFKEVVMASNLVVLSFEGVDTAQGMLENIRDMQVRGLLKLEDAVVAYREPEAPKVEFEQLDHNLAPMASQMAAQPGLNEPVIKQTDSRRKRYAAAGAGAGLLIGVLLGGPIGGAVVGSVIGALKDRGIDDKFIRGVADSLKPDSSAIFLLVKEGGDAEKIKEELRSYKATVVHTTLSPEVEKQLRDALANEI
jgi:uncharacterized membrane protein